MNEEFSNKVCIVTGGATNIGKVTALSFARGGAKVAIIDIKEKEGKETLKEIEQYSEGLFIKTDIALCDNVKKSVKEVYDKFGHIDILVNNAVICLHCYGKDVSEEVWNKMTDVNLKALFFFSQEVSKIMKIQKSGRIINTASSTGVAARKDYLVYTGQKAGVIGLTKALALELAEYNILVNSVSPGYVLTKAKEKLVKDRKFMNWLKTRIPIGRFISMQEIANVYLFLASDRSSAITGQNIIVDGGWLINQG
ncbi:MAG: SDR family oxidoreductase [Actinomycetota bacterium]|nr:SDR family oxidoreductase [Actinomycetota bacterium]